MDKWHLEEIWSEGVSITFSVFGSGSRRAVLAEAQKARKEPYFGPQSYFDERDGISFRIKGVKADKLLAIYQHKDWWVRPAFAGKTADIPARTQLILTKNLNNYTAFLAVCNEECRTDFSGAGEDILVTMASNRGNCCRISGLSFVAVDGEDPYRCCETAASWALELLGHPQRKRESRRYPEMLEYFGWCSWDAFYHRVNEKGILEKMDELKEKHIPVRWVLIDDGWLDADYQEQVLRGLDAEKEKFPEGLGNCVNRLKKEYGISKVGVWHAVMGYWNGLAAGSKAAQALTDGSRKLPDGRIVPDAREGRSFLFYHKWHSYLKEKCGIDFVKVDGQSAVSLFYRGMESFGQASSAIQEGLGASAALNFGNNIINCMGMASEDMWNRPSGAVSRSSDDFVPEVPHGFCEHAVQNSYNSLLQGQFFWGDWDMFWSDHAQNRQNSMLRAISGGPVYVSDPVGKTDAGYIMPLVMSDGRIIRCDGIGMPALDCLFENPAASQKPLKIFNYKKDCYVIAAFLVNQKEKSGSGRISTKDVPGLAGNEYIVWAWTKKALYHLDDENEIPFTLEGQEAEIFVLIPARGDCRVLGLTDKYIGIGAVEYETAKGNTHYALLQEGGEIGIWSRREIRKIICGREEVPFEKDGELYLVRYGSAEKVLVEVIF